MDGKSWIMDDVLLVGDDKIGWQMLSRVAELGNVACFFDKSGGVRRTAELIRKGALDITVVAQMAWAELTRADFKTLNERSIKSNKELLAVLKSLGARRLYLFRAGLIVNQEVLNSGIEIMNVSTSKPFRRR